MTSFSTLDELSHLDGSEQLTEKIKEILIFIREKGFYVEALPCSISIKKDVLTARLFLSLSFQSSLSRSSLSSRLSNRQPPHSPRSFLEVFLDSISS